MNIFFLDNNPIQAAKWSVDKHIVKLPIELGQMLCIPYHLQDLDAPYRLTHKNHPISVWVRQSKANYEWAISYGLALSNEYTERYGKVHKSQAVIEFCQNNIDKLEFPDTMMTTKPQAMPEEYQGDNAIVAYRKYYDQGKRNLHNWKQNKPEWITQCVQSTKKIL